MSSKEEIPMSNDTLEDLRFLIKNGFKMKINCSDPLITLFAITVVLKYYS